MPVLWIGFFLLYLDMDRTKYINQLIEENDYKAYLEIGLGDGTNFRNVVCLNKYGVDPNAQFDLEKFQGTSDEFFANKPNNFDLIFIDGFHHADQVERDIINSWNCLNPKGMILIHDIWPKNEEMTLIPRQTKQWTGDVYKVWHGFKQAYPKIKTEEIEEEWGIGVIYKSRHKIKEGFISDITFEEYEKTYLHRNNR
jgi:hypothetical protein